MAADDWASSRSGLDPDADPGRIRTRHKLGSLSRVEIIIAGRRQEITHQPFPLARPPPADRCLGGERLELADPEIDAGFENGRSERHAPKAYAAGGVAYPTIPANTTMTAKVIALRQWRAMD